MRKRNVVKNNSGEKKATVAVDDGIKTPDRHLEEEPPFLTEPFIDALYKPHTVTILFIAIALLNYFAFMRTPQTMEQNVKRGLCELRYFDYGD